MTTLRESAVASNWAPTIPDEFDGQLLISLPPDFAVTEDWWEELALTHEHVRFELTANRELCIVMASPEGGRITWKIAYQMEAWSESGGGGEGFDSSGGYRLPKGIRKYPDGSWIAPHRVPDHSAPWRRQFQMAPDLIFEVRSPSQSVRRQQAKMDEWIEAGVQLGWLLDPYTRRVWIYRANGEGEQLDDPTELSGEDVCAGLTIDMSRVWGAA